MLRLAFTVKGMYHHHQRMDHIREDNRVHAECHVHHIKDHGMRSCHPEPFGLKGDQLEHGWWDWMEKEDNEEYGWIKGGFYHAPEKFPVEQGCTREDWYQFSLKMHGKTKEEMEKAKKEMEELCARKEPFGTEGCSEQEWIEFKKALEGKPKEEVDRAIKEQEEKCANAGVGQCTKEEWALFAEKTQGLPEGEVEMAKREMEELCKRIPKWLRDMWNAYEKSVWEEFKKRTAGKSEEEIKRIKIMVKSRLARKKMELERLLVRAYTMCREEMKGKTKEEIIKIKKMCETRLKERVRELLSHDERVKRDLRQMNTQFLCNEIIVEVKTGGKHKNWTMHEQKQWEGEDDEDDHKSLPSPLKEGERRGADDDEDDDEEHDEHESSEEHRSKRDDHRDGHRRGGHGEGHRPRCRKKKPESHEEPPAVPEMHAAPKDPKEAESMMHTMEENFEKEMMDMLRKGVHHATLYDSHQTAQNHSQCSVSICKSSTEKNKKCVNNYVGEYKKLWQVGESFPCFYHPDDKMKVFELEPWHIQRDNHEREWRARWMSPKTEKALCIVSFVVFAVWVTMSLTFCVRRCLQCKRECGRPRRYETQVDESPQVVTVDSPALTDKEKEALGELEPPVTPREGWMPTETPSAPPAYVTLDPSKPPNFEAALEKTEKSTDA